MRQLYKLYALVLPAVAVLSSHALAQQGGCVLKDSAPIYASSSGDKVEFTAAKGDCVAGLDGFRKKGERVHVSYFAKKELPAPRQTAWMNPADLVAFDYDCSCDKLGRCSPVEQHFSSSEWNDCFKTARDKLLSSGGESAGAAETAVKALSNNDVIAMTKAGLGDDVVLAKLAAAPAVHFDTSVDELIRLKQNGVGKPVIEAMVKQPERATPVIGGASTKLRSVSAAQVRVTSNHDLAKGCKSLGMVHAEIDTFWGGGSDSVTRKLQFVAAARGANVVVLTGSFTTVQENNGSRLMGDGEAYACSE